MRIKEVARSGAIFERTGESSGIQGGMQWLAAPGLMLCAYGRVEGLSRGGEETHSCVKKCKTIARASIPVTKGWRKDFRRPLEATAMVLTALVCVEELSTRSTQLFSTS